MQRAADGSAAAARALCRVRARPPAVGYFEYPTDSSVTPTAAVPGGASNTANFTPRGGYTPLTQQPLAPTPVGAYTGTTSPYGAYDMAGNVFQWTEAEPCAGVTTASCTILLNGSTTVEAILAK